MKRKRINKAELVSSAKDYSPQQKKQRKAVDKSELRRQQQLEREIANIFKGQ